MAPREDPGLPKLLQGWKSINHYVRALVKKHPLESPYQGGVCLTPTDIEIMKISFDPIADTGFWIPLDPDTTYPITHDLDMYDGVRDRRLFFKNELAEQQTLKIAYCASSEYCEVLMSLTHCSLFRVRDLSGDPPFQEIFRRESIYVYLENHFVFCSPGFPHITIISIQPQRASSRKELLCTEFWTLFFWAQKLAGRGLHTTQRCLPMRLVSICGFEARIVSAVFSSAYPRCIAGKEVACQVYIGEYRDLSDRQNIVDLIVELAATPCGNENVQPKSPTKKEI